MGRRRLAWTALAFLAVGLHGRSLWTGFVEADLFALDTALRTNLDALLRGGALPGGYAPLSRELYWWWWGRVVQLDAGALHVLNAAMAVLGAWFLFRAVERWAGPTPAAVAAAVWATFPPLGTLLATASGARELIAVLWCAIAWACFARQRWWLAALACGLAGLSGAETLLIAMALVVADFVVRPAERPAQRWPRLLPAVLAAAASALVMARAHGGVAAPAAGAGALTGFVRSWIPDGAWSGLSATWRQAPWLVVALAALAMLAVPGGHPERDPTRRLLPIGLTAALASLLLVALAGEPARPERFAVAALGVAVAAGALVLRSPWPARVIVTVGTLVSLGANAITPAPGASPDRFTSSATIRARAAAITPLLAALRPWCGELASVPRTFAAGVPPDSLFRLAFRPGAAVVCRDPRVSIGFLAELTPREAAGPFGVLRFDAASGGFRFEHADARVKALVGEGLLIFARHAPAAACFEAAASERPLDRELVYPTVSAVASAGRADEARARWRAARRDGRTFSPDSLALRLLAGYAGPNPEGERREIERLAVAVTADPASAAAHLALGRRLLEAGLARSGTMEISVACGIGRRSQDVYWLARGYDALGARAEALEAYRAALAGGLDSTEYRFARGRLAELLRSLGPAALAPENRP